MKDVFTIYAKAFLLPLALFMLVMTILILFDLSMVGILLSSIFVLPLVVGGLSIVIYWIASKKRFNLKFSQNYPGIVQDSMDRPKSFVALTLWQLLCVGAVNIAFSIMAFGSIMGLLATQVI
jgi:hypothetical protein